MFTEIDDVFLPLTEKTWHLCIVNTLIFTKIFLCPSVRTNCGPGIPAWGLPLCLQRWLLFSRWRNWDPRLPWIWHRRTLRQLQPNREHWIVSVLALFSRLRDMRRRVAVFVRVQGICKDWYPRINHCYYDGRWRCFNCNISSSRQTCE